MELPVLHERPTDQSPVGAQRRHELLEGLRACVRGEVRLGRHDRMLYATDASMYQVEPLGVVLPVDEADVARAVEYCWRCSLPMLPRGGGTSLAGQCTAEAVVIDTSAFCRRIGAVNTEQRWVEVSCGVAIDELNKHLARLNTGLFFAPDPATTAQATVGGCIGNNAAGSRSIKYGRTVDSVASIDAVLSSGARVVFERGAGARSPLALKLADAVIGIVRRYEPLIRERFPRTLRRNAGYALDLMLSQLDAGATPQELDLVPLLCGSEGTLAITLGARLRLFPVPAARGLALLSFPSVDEAIAVVASILTSGPSAVELVDDVVIEAALGNRECRSYVAAFPTIQGRTPAAVLYVEYHEESLEALRDRLERLRSLIGQTPMREVLDPSAMAEAWKLRKAGEPLLHGLPGPRKPVTFVEDNAVPVERLGEFVREFRAIVQRAGTRAAFWAHASVGVLHVRPMLDPTSEADQATLRAMAVEIADLARRCGGVMSGEHGDGKVRGPLLERYFGPELVRAFGEVKGVFDPKGLLNHGNIVGAGPIESITQRTRIDPIPGAGPDRRPRAVSVETYFDYSSEDGFDHAVSLCNGAGVCRKQSGGTMCPSYRATNDERHSTRGRGNALRLAITGQSVADTSPAGRFSDPETIATLDLCLSCKACKTECPSNVDVARYKAEYTAQRYRLTGRIPLRERLIGHVRALNRLGSATPRLANWVNGWPPVRWLINRVMRIHPRRSLPKFSPSLWRAVRWAGELSGTLPSNRTGTPRPRVVLFADCFTAFNESRIGVSAVRVLRALGYDVDIPRVGCCARSMISVGMLEQAIRTADATLATLTPALDDPGVLAVLVCEPSCLSAFKDDWLALRCRTPLSVRRRLAEKAMLVEEFIDRHWDTHPDRAWLEQAAAWSARQPGEVVLHAHCHQRALWGEGSSARVLRRLAGGRVRVLPTGCCGMAGSFGYDREKFDLSMRIAELTGVDEPAGGVLPFVRALRPEDTFLATGTSCRHQVYDGTRHFPPGPVRALHPIEWIDRLLLESRARARSAAPNGSSTGGRG
jgi:FAD/FMN-containing dehydrogenase/Fe-S oxidoreductase